MKTCNVSGCKSAHYARGMCNKHYQRWQAHGDPMITKRAPNGAGHINVHGYRVIHKTNLFVAEHILIVEKIIGRKLPVGSEIHHVNGDKADNKNTNLVVCQDRAYHKLLHVRQNAYDSCGNANYRRCFHCRSFDDPSNMKFDGYKHYHSACHNLRMKDYHKNRKARGYGT